MQREERAAVCCFTFFIFQSPVKSAPDQLGGPLGPACLPALVTASASPPSPGSSLSPPPPHPHPTTTEWQQVGLEPAPPAAGLRWPSNRLACEEGAGSFLPASCLAFIVFPTLPAHFFPRPSPAVAGCCTPQERKTEAQEGLGTRRRPGESSPGWRGRGRGRGAGPGPTAWWGWGGGALIINLRHPTSLRQGFGSHPSPASCVTLSTRPGLSGPEPPHLENLEKGQR